VSKTLIHNREIIRSAESRASEMMVWPSPLEERMKVILDAYKIRYEQQKIFYIHAKDGWIIRYYIADFFVPHRNLIIEVDGKFHEYQKQHDRNRTKDIQKEYPMIDVIRFSWKDVSDRDKMECFIRTLL
jgi:very-short-patch-repair endonuclease